MYSIDKSLAWEPLDIAYARIQEQSALITINPPRGQLVAKEESENAYVSALNQLIDSEFKANDFDATICDTVYTGTYFNLGWIKTGVDYNQYGTFGQKGKITIDEVDPKMVHVDPECKRLDWDCVAFIIQEHRMQIGEIREAYPETGFDIPDEAESPQYSAMDDQKAEDSIISPVPKLSKAGAWKRQELKVYEAWFKDTRLKFVPDRKDREYYDDDGNWQIAKNDLVLDDDGFVIGDWVPAYPKGRCIVISEGRVLEDMPNRLPHGRCPLIPVRQASTRNPFVPGDAVRILRPHMRYNDVLSRGHAYAQSEIERPMHAEIGVFPNAQYWKKIPNKSDKIIPVNPGRALLRPPAVDLPPFFFPLLDKYENLMDMISGSSPIMRGSIQGGSQLSAEAVSNLQSTASSRVAQKAKLLASAVVEATFQVMWLIRCVYDEKITVQVTLPDGSSSSLDWESDREVFESGDEDAIAKLTSQESYIVDIKAGTGTPNAQAAQQAVADKLFDRKAIPVHAYLDAYQYPNRQAFSKEMEEQEKQDIAAEALGRKVGMNVKLLEKKADGDPGRREKV